MVHEVLVDVIVPVIAWSSTALGREEELVTFLAIVGRTSKHVNLVQTILPETHLFFGSRILDHC